MEDPKKKKQQINYGYFVDEDGLYYYSEKNGMPYEVFDINGIATATLDFNKIDLIYLAYIYENDKHRKKKT